MEHKVNLWYMQWSNRERWWKATPGLIGRKPSRELISEQDLNKAPAMSITGRREWKFQGPENKNQTNKHKVTSFGWKKKKKFQDPRMFPSPGRTSIIKLASVALWISTMKWGVGPELLPLVLQHSFQKQIIQGLGQFSSLTSISEENVTQGHYFSMARHSCWMPALCPATEGCQAWKRSRKPVAGYCLSKLNKNATCLESDMQRLQYWVQFRPKLLHMQMTWEEGNSVGSGSHEWVKIKEVRTVIDWPL